MSHEEQSKSHTQSRLQPVVKLIQTANGGQILFWGLLLIAGYMFVTAGQFSPAASLFPRLAAGTIIVAGTLRLIVNIFDLDIQAGDSLTLSSGQTDEETNEVTNFETMVVLGALITGYVIGGYLVGLLWVTPLFVLSYMLFTGQPHWKSVVWTVGLTGVAYGFMTIMELDLARGVLYG